MAFTPFSAKNSPVRSGAGATVLTAKKWVVDDKVDELDVSNFEAAGFYDFIPGLKMARITIDFDIDGQANPWDATPSWKKGTTGTLLKCYHNSVTGPYWSFPSYLVVSGPTTADVKQAAQSQVVIVAKGAYVEPTGTLAS